MMSIIFAKMKKILACEKVWSRRGEQDTAEAPKDYMTNKNVSLCAQVKSEVYGTGWGETGRHTASPRSKKHYLDLLHTINRSIQVTTLSE